jgi:type II restriction/modification system DNA methylase subunit YeeA
MTPHQFIHKWKAAQLSERSACQQHFLDLCELLGQPKPAEADPEGAWYTFERGVRKMQGGHGWADVWMRGHFGWEYKGKHKDLAAAYHQLLQYREDLENPPLLIVCDLDRFEIHTNFTGTAKHVYSFDLAGLAKPQNLDVLRRVFTDPESLRPGQTTEAVTKQAAEMIGQIADGMRVRGVSAHDAAHFLMKLMFSMFAEDIGLLRNKVFTNILKAAKDKPPVLAQRMQALFEAMSTGGYFGADEVLHFNGGLFADATVIELKPDEIRILVDVAALDWSDVEPSIFGTLFERMLDPDKRSQIGAHYTSRADIETLMLPVVMQPLRREWESIRAECDELWRKVQAASRKSNGKGKRRAVTPKQSPAGKKLEKRLRDFTHRLEDVTILDPACGSGNFLYVALNLLLDLNKEVISYAAQRGITLFPSVRPTQLLGIEINEYAQELASVVIWIGYLQWMHDNGFTPQLDPVLEPFQSIRRMDAILDLSDPAHPREPEWPAAEFIVGNPPFLGASFLRAELGERYVDAMNQLWSQRIPKDSDLCCYWFEKARQQIEARKSARAGLLATQGIRGGVNRTVLDRIKNTGNIFFAVSDRNWILDGANVHISMVGFDEGTETTRTIDGKLVPEIHSNLTGGADITRAKRLRENRRLFLRPPEKGGKFEMPLSAALPLLNQPNPNGQPTSDILVRWINAKMLVGTDECYWIVDYPSNFTKADASGYEAAFKIVEENVREFRSRNRYVGLRNRWWIYRRPGDRVRDAQRRYSRLLCTPMVSKHRVFVWLDPVIQPDKTIYAYARDDDYFFGVLHSRAHEVWGLKLGTRLETRPRYTPTTCFETFPFPEPTDAQREAIATAARELDTLRNNWLNPPEWTRTEVLEFPGSLDGPWRRYIDTSVAVSLRETIPPAKRKPPTIGTVRYPRIVPKDEECAKLLKRRTLTNLYNERPTWLALAHEKLDAAVFDAYGWDPAMSDDDLLAALLALNLQRAEKQDV